jgi:hypothetical protein
MTHEIEIVDGDTPLAQRDDTALARAEPSIERLMEIALKSDKTESLERLVALHERMQANRARGEFHEAMAKFKAECPPIPRRSENPQFSVTRDGRKVASKFASLEDIGSTIRPALAKHGLDFRWSDYTISEGFMELACIVSHVGSHSEASSMKFPLESKAGASPQQLYAIVNTYLRRYTLVNALGLTTVDDDNDGNEASGSAETITEHQAANINAMLDELKADRKVFLEYMGVESIEKMPVSRFKEAIAAIEKKRRKQDSA